MIIKGNWKGQYRYDNKSHQKMMGFDATNFEIDILSVDDAQFTGSVTDDAATGGMDGVGEIVGKVTGNKIEFVKQMPVAMFRDSKGTRRTLNKKHRKIYYSGIISEDGKEIAGVWLFKFGFIWIGIVPIPVNPITGTWKCVQWKNRLSFL